MKKENLKWNIYKAGVVADLTVSEWGARSKLKADELGMRESDIPDQFFLGHKNLMKKEHLARLRYVSCKAEAFLLANSFAFPFGDARFVPFNLLKKVMDFMQACRKEYTEALEEFLEAYNGRRAEMIAEFREVFIDMARKQHHWDESMVEKIISRLRNKYPDKDTLRYKFNFDFMVFEVSSPEFKSVQDDVVVDEAEQYMEDASLYQQKAGERIDAFLEDVVARLKAMVLKTTENMKKRLEGDDLGKNTIKAFVKFAESFKGMDFVGTDLESTLKAFGDKIKDMEKSELSDEQVKIQLQSDVAEIEEKAMTLDIDTVVGRFLRRIDLGAEEDEIGVATMPDQSDWQARRIDPEEIPEDHHDAMEN